MEFCISSYTFILQIYQIFLKQKQDNNDLLTF
jgi:hypothetical protein